MRKKITLPLLKGLKPSDKETFIWDTALPGFGVRVKPNGTASFVLQYRAVEADKHRRKTLGRVGAPGHPTLDQARRAAEKTLAQVRLGGDPVGEERKRREAITVAALCEEYLEEARAGRILTRSRRPKATSTIEIDAGRIAAHIIPLLGKKRVEDLTPQDVRRFMREVEAGKTARDDASGKLRGRTVIKGGAGTARRTVGLLGGILTFAVQQGYRSDNPARGVERSADGRRTLGDVPTIYAALGRALHLAEAAGEDWRALALVRLIALTGMRRQEAVNLRWSEIRQSSGTVVLEHSKTGESVRPLPRAALELLNSLPGAWEGGYVFPAPRSPGAAYGSLANAWNRLRKSDQLSPADRETLATVTLHHLRHAAATTGHEIGLSLPTVGAILGHSVSGTTASYVHVVDRALRAASDRLGEEIARMVEGEAVKQAGSVVSFPS